ncbi:MAG: ecdysteroid 22-kinase family protein, partial [Acidimicrobiia bacterium]|nr:ecdysteroid 22-kinase family protein [Acidimicrobiia bacterium]
VVRSSEIGHGKGTFSDVYRLWLSRRSDARLHPPPRTVVAKLPTESPNRDGAAADGAYLREYVAYRHLLGHSPVSTPTCLGQAIDGTTAAFLLEDLTGHRFVDQIDGLQASDAATVAEHLARLHRFWSRRLSEEASPVAVHHVRGATVARFAPERLLAGLEALAGNWEEIGGATIKAFAGLMDNRDRLVETFVRASGPRAGGGAFDPPSVTLCHGDPRADNLCFAQDGTPVLFDWQQIAVQFGEADLAWLMATSLDPEVRRAGHEDLVGAYGADIDRLRLGFVLPGLAALMLAQRTADHPRTRRFIATSLIRIGSALQDYEVAGIGSHR